MRAAAIGLSMIGLAGCVLMGRSESDVIATARNWCSQEKPGDAGCVDRQIGAFRKIDSVVPDPGARSRMLESCRRGLRQVGDWVDYEAVLECATNDPKHRALAQSYVDAIAKEPSQLTVPRAKAAVMLARAQVFLAKFGTQKIQTATDYVVETFNPGAAGHSYVDSYACSITRVPLEGDSDRVEVRCEGMLYGVARPAGAVMLFMRDGTEPSFELVSSPRASRGW